MRFFCVVFSLGYAFVAAVVPFWPRALDAAPLNNWHQRSVMGDFYRITFGNGVFVAVTGAGEIVRSDDGVYWSVAAAPTTKTLRGMAYGGGRWVAAGAGGTLLASADGIG
jgi:hypothetical protein